MMLCYDIKLHVFIFLFLTLGSIQHMIWKRKKVIKSGTKIEGFALNIAFLICVATKRHEKICHLFQEKELEKGSEKVIHDLQL